MEKNKNKEVRDYHKDRSDKIYDTLEKNYKKFIWVIYIQVFLFIFPILSLFFYNPLNLQDFYPLVYKGAVFLFIFRYLTVIRHRLEKMIDRHEKIAIERSNRFETFIQKVTNQ